MLEGKRKRKKKNEGEDRITGLAGWTGEEGRKG
jgi:hypothetical protein